MKSLISLPECRQSSRGKWKTDGNKTLLGRTKNVAAAVENLNIESRTGLVDEPG